MPNRRILNILASGLFAAAALAQQPTAASADGSFHFTSPTTPQALEEARIIVRTVAQLQDASIAEGQATLTFHGTQDNVAVAEWILGELDRPGGETAPHEYKMPNGEVARVHFLLPSVATPQGMQEVLTVLRTVADMQRVFNYTSRLAIVSRGKEEDIGFSEWILDQLNQPAQPKPDTTPREYTLATNNRAGNAARVNFLANVTTARGMQELLTVLRTVGDVARVFNLTGEHALVLRGTDAGIERAEWLIQGLDQPTGQQNAGTHAYNAPNADDVTRIFYLLNATPQGLQSALTAVRTEARINKAYSTTTPAALVVRGTADQVEAAARVIAAGNGLALLRH